MTAFFQRPRLDLFEIGAVAYLMNEAARLPGDWGFKTAIHHRQLPFTLRKDTSRRGALFIAFFEGEDWSLSATIREKWEAAGGGTGAHHRWKADWNYHFDGDRERFDEDWLTAHFLVSGRYGV